MQNIPVLKSKLIMPQLASSFIMSERIESLCRSMYEHSVVSVTAPAGYGKTTLIIAALNMYEPGSRICWYRLEQEDREPAVFYNHLLETLFPAGEEEGAQARHRLARCGDIQAPHHYLNAAVCQELWAFAQRHPGLRTFLVLDDFQQAKDIPEIIALIQYLINNLPENCSIIVSSRSETDAITVKQKLEKSIREINSGDLSFSEEELKTLFIRMNGSKINKEQLHEIMVNTEGWVAGIIILCQAFSTGHAGKDGAIGEKSGQKDFLFKYFAIEVLKAVDPGLMLFLVKSALLREFTAAEAGALLNMDQVPRVLELCEKKGLFIQKIVGQVTTYRFHGLFREVLLQMQPEYLTLEEIDHCHHKAAAYYTANGAVDRAIEHFLACGGHVQAAELILRESARLDPFQSIEQLRAWLRFLSEDAAKNNAIIFYIKNHIRSEGEEYANMDLPESMDDQDIAAHMKTLIIFSYFYVSRNDVGNIVNTLNQVPSHLKHTRNPELKGNLAVFDLMKAFWEERFARGLVLSKKVDSLGLDPDWEWMRLAYSGKLHFLRGDLESAGGFIKRALDMDLIRENEMIRSIALMLYAHVLYLKQDRAAFSLIKTELTAIGEKYHFDLVLGYGKRLAALDSYGRHDQAAALELLDSSTQHFERLGNRAMVLYNQLSRCLWLSGETGARQALAEAKKAYKELRSYRPGFCILDIGQSILGALAREAGDYAYAHRLLSASIENSRAKKTRQILCGAYLHLAQLYYDSGDQANGQSILQQAFHIAARNRYFTFWDLHLPTLVEMSARCLQSNLYRQYVLELMTRYFGEEAAGFFQSHIAGSGEADLKDACRAFISLYGSEAAAFSSRVYVRLLGSFSITVNGRLIPGDSWKTKKIEGILKYLLLNRDRLVSRERLMGLFWPESDKKSASISLRAALYELRKVLKRYGVPLEGPEALIHERSGGLTIPSGRMLGVDRDEFLSLGQKLKNLPSGPSAKIQRIGLLERMTGLYRGHLFEDDLYEDWIFSTREELKSMYMKSALSLAGIYAEAKENEKAEKLLLKALALDPYSEEACLGLLNLYMATRQKNRAINLYAAFEDRVKKDLDTQPDAKLASVVQDIL